MDRGTKRLFALWHRRSGKDITLWNVLIREAFLHVGLYYYFLPTYAQAKKIIWDGITNEGFKFIDHVPKPFIERKNEQEMKIVLKNGSIIQLIGTDSYDSIRGTNPKGCVFSEYAFQNPMAWEVVKPILKVNDGWAIFNTTPNGKNHAYDLYNVALSLESWFCETLSITDTGVLTKADMDEEREEGMTDEMIAQEYYCSFDVGALGAYYTRQLKELKDQERITTIPVQENVPVDLWLDLGRNDATSVVFTQAVGKEIRIVDFFEHTGEAVGFYAKAFQEKNYLWGTLFLPHDAKHKRLESKKTIEEQFKEAGFKTKIVQKTAITNGIQELRKLFPRLWFDKDKTKDLLRCLENYHKEWDEKAKVFREVPKHDWSSHAADAMRYMAVGWREKPDDSQDYVINAKSFIDQKPGVRRPDPGLGRTVEDHVEYHRAAKDFLRNAK
jgi:hypothetical protein|tara:strand:- start:906 stop:2228 length:1323 start_codon:yes stop_codon:yes gene_type:complete